MIDECIWAFVRETAWERILKWKAVWGSIRLHENHSEQCLRSSATDCNLFCPATFDDVCNKDFIFVKFAYRFITFPNCNWLHITPQWAWSTTFPCHRTAANAVSYRVSKVKPTKKTRSRNQNVCAFHKSQENSLKNISWRPLNRLSCNRLLEPQTADSPSFGLSFLFNGNCNFYRKDKFICLRERLFLLYTTDRIHITRYTERRLYLSWKDALLSIFEH